MQASAMKVCFLIVERSLSYAKIMQASAMKVYFLIAERSLSYAKIVILYLFCVEFSKFYFSFSIWSNVIARGLKKMCNDSKYHQE